ELLVRRERAVEEEAGRHGPRSLRIALDRAAAEARDKVERARDRGGRHAAAAQPLADEAAADPPIRHCRETLLVRGAVLDLGHLVGSAELGPAETVVSVEDERCVSGSRANARELALAVDARGVLAVVGVEPHAPAAAEDAVVALDERGEGGPGRFVE